MSGFVDADVEFVVIGGHAYAAHYQPRATKDLDLWIRPTQENAGRVFGALARFGAPLAGVTPEDFARPGLVFQIGVEPHRVDVITSIKGVTFEDAWPGRISAAVEGVTVPVIGRADLIRNKLAVGRPRDRLDAKDLMSLDQPAKPKRPRRSPPRRKRH